MCSGHSGKLKSEDASKTPNEKRLGEIYCGARPGLKM